MFCIAQDLLNQSRQDTRFFFIRKSFFCLSLNFLNITLEIKIRKKLNKKKSSNLLVTFKELLEKSAFLKIAAQASEAGDFLNIFLRFWGICGSFTYRNFSYIKKTCIRKRNETINSKATPKR